MQGELVITTTPDHLRLHGFYQRSIKPLRTSSACGTCDAAILLHGLGGNFYSSRLLNHFCGTLDQLGVATVLANTRGHDMINTSNWAGRAKSVGSALENVSDSVHDIFGWVRFLEQRGHQNILLLGHSLGAIKSLYTMAHQPPESVRSLVGLSATRLSYQRLIESESGPLFRETLDRCTELIEAGQGESPIRVPFPFPTWMTPEAYLEKYGPEESYNWLRFVDKLEIPALLIFGSRELDENPAFDGLRAELQQVRQQWNTLTIDEIEGADHFYTSRFDAVDDVVVRWLG